MDVEGAEVDVLHGAERLLRTNQVKVMMIELNKASWWFDEQMPDPLQYVRVRDAKKLLLCCGYQVNVSPCTRQPFDCRAAGFVW